MIGVDFGGTRIKGALVDGETIQRKESVDTPTASAPPVVLDTIAELVAKLTKTPSSIGVAIPGEVDDEGKCWRLPNVPGFEGVNIQKELESRIGCAVAVENDATTAALGELRYGFGSRFQSFVLATLGTGVGGGVVIDGKLHRGAHGFAGEIGHIQVDSSESAWPCPCGRKGCMEAYAGTRGLVRAFQVLGGKVDEPHEIADLARQGDENALEAFRSMGRALGVGFAQILKVLDVDALVVSGGISASFDLMETAMRTTLRAHVFGKPTGEIPIVVSELGSDAGLIGAALLPSLRKR
jgi:glucokinase